MPNPIRYWRRSNVIARTIMQSHFQTTINGSLLPGEVERYAFWDVRSGQVVKQIQAHRQRIRSLRFTSANEIVSCGDDQIVRFSNVQTGQSRALPRHSSKLFAVALLSDDLIATSGSDNRIHIWQISSTRKLGTLDGHTGTVSCLDVSGNQIASGAYDTEVRVWHFDPNFDPAFRETRKSRRQLG